jgi:hypothetical protein
MKASRELDILIARHITKLARVYQVQPNDAAFTVHRDFVEVGDYCYDVPGGGIDEVPHYSTDIAAAWQVLERMYDLGCHVARIGIVHDWREKYECVIGAIGNMHTEWNVDAETAPMAICVAALKAKGITIDDA